jgi:hypothetical protein
MRTAVESSVDWPVVLAILFENVPQEHQLRLQAVFFTKSFGSVHQNRHYSLFIGWVMLGLGVEVEIGVCGLAVHFVSQRTIRSPVHKVQEREVAFSFGFHGKMNGLMDAV